MRIEMDYLINLINNFLPLSKWDFIESLKSDTVVILNSPCCRLKFSIVKDRYDDHLFFSYGRLHAKDNSRIIKWKGKDCYCWHGTRHIQLALKYLDGQSPNEAYQRPFVRHRLFADYFNTERLKYMKYGTEERIILLQDGIWEKYGMRFFELFDLRQPDFWENYLDFLREYYKLEEMDRETARIRRGVVGSTPFDPPLYRRC